MKLRLYFATWVLVLGEACLCSGVVAAPPIAGPDRVRATLLSGQSIEGRITSIDRDGLRLTSEGDVRLIGPQEIELLEFLEADDSASLDDPSGWIELADGSLLPLEDWRWDDTGCSVLLSPRLRVESEWMDVRPDSVRAFRYRGLSDDQSRQWKRLLDGAEPVDSIVVVRASGELDQIKVVATEMAPQFVRALLDDEPIEAPKSKVVGLILSAGALPKALPESALATGVHGMRLSLSSVRYDATSGYSILTCCGLDAELKPGALSRLDYRAGNVVYLSDLTPLRVETKPYFSDDTAPSRVAARWIEPRWDQAHDGGPLRLLAESMDGYAQERSFAKGIAVRSRTTIEFTRPDGFSKLAAMAGLDPEAPEVASALVTVLGDGEALFECTLASGDAAIQLRVDVGQHRRITLVVDYGENLDIGDRVVLADARFVR